MCLVLDVDGKRASGCRRKVADVRYPLVVALAAQPERIVAAAFPDAAEQIQVLPQVSSARSLNALIIAQGQTARRLRWKISSPDPARTETLPPGDEGSSSTRAPYHRRLSHEGGRISGRSRAAGPLSTHAGSRRGLTSCSVC